jgi:hypothetical protein
MEDRVAQFFVTVAKLCADANLGALSVRVRLENGEHVVGVPAPPPESEGRDQLDGTGYADTGLDRRHRRRAVRSGRGERAPSSCVLTH